MFCNNEAHPASAPTQGSAFPFDLPAGFSLGKKAHFAWNPNIISSEPESLLFQTVAPV